MSTSLYAETVNSATDSNGNSISNGALVIVDPKSQAQSFDYARESSAFQSPSAPLPLVPVVTTQAITPYRPSSPPATTSSNVKRCPYPQLIATISAGFEKGDYLIREEKGSNIYFDFFEEAFNFISQKGYTRMPEKEEEEYLEIVKHAHKSVPGGCRFNTGRLLMVLRKRLIPVRVWPYAAGDPDEPLGQIMEESVAGSASGSTLRSSSLIGGSKSRNNTRRKGKSSKAGKGAIATDTDSTVASSAYSSAASTTDSWE